MGVSNFGELRDHVGHAIECLYYGDDCVCIECADCNAILFDFERDPPPEPNKLWVLRISFRFGEYCYMFQEKEKADEQLFLYVRDNWSDQFPGKFMPDNPDEAVEDYFAINEREGYILTEEDVLGEVIREQAVHRVRD